jgi:hypothetical protein
MLRLFLTLLLLTGNAYALPIDLSTALYNTSAYAELGADSDGIHADSSPPTDLPLFSHAEVIGNDVSVREFAHADAVADSGFLAVSSEAQGSLNHAGAVAEAALEQTLSIAGIYFLELNFESLLDLVGGEASASLGLVVSAGSRTLFDEIFTSSAEISRRFVLAPGEIGLLYIGLTSTADAMGDGLAGDLYAFNLATVEVALNAVPSPTPLALIVAGLVPMLRRRRVRAE